MYTKSIVFLGNKGGVVKLSTRVRYGTKALLDLALHRGEAPVLLRDIAERQQISLRYLEQLVTPLIAGGIVRSARGAGGGVWLAKHPEEVRLSQVLQLLGGSITLVDCLNNPDSCNQSELCVTRDIWGELQEAMRNVLESTTLQDLVERQKAKELAIKSEALTLATQVSSEV